jgi:tetratricopeptide (TPR) repeat protein
MRALCLFSLLMLAGCAGTTPLPPRALELNDAGAKALAEGNLETADARLSLALEYSPHFVDALVNLALVECQRGNFVRARQLLLRARRINPDVAQPHHALGVLAERERRPDRASEHYRDALRVDPGFAPARSNLGRLEFHAGQLEAAYLTFKKLAEIAPEQPDGYVGLAETLIRLERVEEALAITREASGRFPFDPGLVLLAARAELRAGRVEASVQLLTPLATRHDDFAATALGWLATAELARGEPRRAVGAAQRALSLEPDEPVAVRALAGALFQLQDPSAAAWAERSRRLSSQ